MRGTTTAGGDVPSWAREELDDGPGVLEAVWRYRWGVLLSVLLGALFAYTASSLQDLEYEAETRVFLQPPMALSTFEGGQSAGDTSRYVLQAAEIAQTTAVAEDVRDRLGSSLPLDELRKRYVVEAEPEQNLLTITATAGTPQGAARFADTVAAAYREQVRRENEASTQRQVEELAVQIEPLRERIAAIDEANVGNTSGPSATDQAGREVLLQRIADLESRIAALQFDADTFNDGVRSVDPAMLPGRPSQPRPLLSALAGALLSGLAAAAVAWWRNRSTQAADRRQDPARVLHAPLLGEVPEFGNVGVTSTVPAAEEPFSQAGEAYEFVMSSLTFSLQERESPVLLVTSPGPGDGKSVSTLNLAVAAARDGRRVALVDADVRMAGLSALCDVDDPVPGLTDVSVDEFPVSRALRPVGLPGAESVFLVTVGESVPDLVGFFRTPGFRHALERLRAEADLVLIDSPPLLSVAETSAIAGQADGIVLIVRRGTRLRLLEDLAERLSFIGAPLLGYVFNRSGERAPYGAYGGYGPPRRRDPRAHPDGDRGGDLRSVEPSPAELRSGGATRSR